jgi:hypothetical protein
VYSGRRLSTFQRCLQPSSSLMALTLEAPSTSETSVNSYRTTRRNIPEDSHLQNLGNCHWVKCRLSDVTGDPRDVAIFVIVNARTCFIGNLMVCLSSRASSDSSACLHWIVKRKYHDVLFQYGHSIVIFCYLTKIIVTYKILKLCIFYSLVNSHNYRISFEY